MNKSCLLLLALLPLSAHADSDDLRRLSEENGRVQQQYRESGWLDGGTPAGDIENDDAYIRIGGQIYTVGNNTEELESAIYHAINASPRATPPCPATIPPCPNWCSV